MDGASGGGRPDRRLESAQLVVADLVDLAVDGNGRLLFEIP
jgi:hypothetical protein